MPQPVWEKCHARPILEDLDRITPEDAQLQKPLDRDLMRPRVHIIPHHALLEHLRTLLLHAEHQVVDLPAFVVELPTDGERPRDIRRVALVFPRSIQQQIPPPPRLLVVLLVMQRRRIRA